MAFVRDGPASEKNKAILAEDTIHQGAKKYA